MIVETVGNPKAEISLQEARQYDSEAEIGDEIGSLIEMNELGRIAAQTAKQVIFQKVREAEWEAVQKRIFDASGGSHDGNYSRHGNAGITLWISERQRPSCRSKSRFRVKHIGAAIV